jgi:orotidine-5'-phosphate decarboxylase
MQTDALMGAEDRLIVALDCPTVEKALSVVDEIGPAVTFYKIGWRMYLTGGMEIVERVRDQNKKIFLDLKMDDIAETIETAVEVLRDKVHLLTLMGAPATIRAAVVGRGSAKNPRLLSVTLLSSLDEQDLRSMFPPAVSLPKEEFLPAYVRHRACQAFEAGADGLIASGDSVKQLRAAFGPEPLIVTPGIRPSGSNQNDQKRIKTPGQAIVDGSDLLVVGRPVWGAENPKAAAEAIIEEIAAAL